MIPNNQFNVKKKTTTKEILDDFEEHKKFSLSIQLQLASFLTGANRDRVLSCGDFLQLARYKDEAQTSKVQLANFCKNRMCPMCSWRKHLKVFEALRYAVEQVQGDKYHIVLTIPNLKYIDKKFFKDFKISAVDFLRKELNCNDYVMSLEITISETGEFHPHFHVLAKCDLDNKKKRDLQHTWAQYLKVKRSWVMLHYDKADSNTLHELTKYIVKFESKRTPTIRLKQIYFATHGIRTFSMAGKFKEAYAFAKSMTKSLKENEIKELLKYGNPEIEFYKWFGNFYGKID